MLLAVGSLAVIGATLGSVLGVAARYLAVESDPLEKDLLELLHTVTRLKSIPSLRESQELPEAERTRGAEIADRLTVPALARAWQMLLKGVGEVETAPDRRAAAEMVLIRLCHVSDMPTPGDLVRRLISSGASTPQPTAPGPSGGGGVRAVANGAPMTLAAPDNSPRMSSFRDVAAFVESQREALLHSHLLHNVHIVRFAPPVIEWRQDAAAPRDLPSRLAALLQEATKTRWTIAVSAAPGEPTLAEQGMAADTARRNVAADHPLVRAILDAFPGARLESVHDANTDRYGLPAEVPLGEPDMPDFAPLDAELFDDSSSPWELDA